MENIILTGSIAYDKIMDFPKNFKDHIMPDKIHALSVCFLVEKLKINFGGTAGNIAYNLKLLNENPIIFSQAGQDFTEYKKWLDKNKIKTDHIKLIKNKNTASAHIITDKSDNQITALHLETMGVPCYIKAAQIKKYLPSLAIISPGNIEDMVAAAGIYKKLDIPYIADPGQQIPALSNKDLKTLFNGAKVLICNDYEFDLIKQKTKLTNKQLENLVEILVITYGAKGSVVYNNHKTIKIKSFKPKRIVDPTGAGDAYRAGFIKGLINNWDLKKCGELASKVAKYPVEHYGTQEHKFTFNNL